MPHSSIFPKKVWLAEPGSAPASGLRRFSRGPARRDRPDAVGWRAAPSSILLACLLAVPAAPQDLAELEERTIRAAVERVAPCVVKIDTVGGLEQIEDVLLGEGPTTGLIVSDDGLIISSSFNFLRQPSSILVTLPGGRRVPARIAARDHSRKLVLLRVESPDPLPVPDAVPPHEVVVGQGAIAVGRTFHPDRPNLSVGIISARGRIWGKALQTDAKVSPANYGGPLLDLTGRVFGILVPLSPSSQHELAGAEWYDGGIGFAVPLSDVFQRLDRMKQGEDLHPGILGVTLKTGDIYSLPAELAACHPKSPAYQAGVRAGDTIVAVNGVAIERQSQLRHALGPLYAGDKVRLEVMRGSDRHSATVELAREIAPYEHPFLGVLPVRGGTGEPPGVVIRHVLAGSAASAAGLRAGDAIRGLAGRGVADAAALREALAAFEPGQEIVLTVTRDGGEQPQTARLGALPDAFPPEDAAAPPPAKPVEKPVAVTEIKIPEEPNACVAYVPASYRRDAPHGLLVVLPVPGPFQPDDFTQQWWSAAERYGLIVAAPQARLPNMWLPTETAFVRKVIDHLAANYNIDRTRVVVYGSGAGGAMAYLTAFRLRDVVRGVVAVDAAIPVLMARPPDNDPIERLGVVVIQPSSSDAKTRISENITLLREMKYPVIVKELAAATRDVDEETRAEILRWIDTLDRI